MLQPPEDQDLTVVDAMIWPEITTYVVALAGFGDVPQIAPGLVTPTQMLDFLLRVAVNHKAMPDFHAAAAEAAALAGASWILTPDAPLALANQRYDRVEPPHAFHNILELEAEDPRLAGDEAWAAHPQADFGIRCYNPQGHPILMRAVALLPTMEVVSSLVLPEPGEVSFLQLLLGMGKGGEVQDPLFPGN